jgi:hypothetical protein
MQLDFSCNGTNGAEYISTNQVYTNTWNFFAMTCRYNGTNATSIYYINDVSMQTLVGLIRRRHQYIHSIIWEVYLRVQLFLQTRREI